MSKFLDWIKKAKVRPVTDVPFKQEKEKFKGIKITLPSFFEWWFKPKGE